MKTKYLAIAAIAGSMMCGSAMAGQYATALGQCLYKNSSSSDKTTLTQWAFVNLGKTDAAKSIVTIPTAKTNEVDKEAQSVVTKLISSSCSSEAKQVALKEPTSGLRDAMVAVTSEMVKERLTSSVKSSFSSSILSSGSSSQITETGKSLKSLLKK